jgi:branched-chain amino acid transport system substrate-binding protein
LPADRPGPGGAHGRNPTPSGVTFAWFAVSIIRPAVDPGRLHAPPRQREISMNRLTKLGLALGLSLGAAGQASAQIKMAVGAPITGPSAATGAQMKNGVDQAAADINAAGGILGQKIVVSYGDDVSDPKQGVSVANKLAADGVKFVVGHYNSGVTIPSSDVYQENGILQITPASTNPTVTERGLWNIFRVCGRDDQQGAVAGAYILQNFKGKKVAVVHDKTTYGKGLADETRKAINAGGLKEVLYEGVNTGEKDYSALVSKIKQSGADLVYWGGLYSEGGLIVRQMRDQGVKAPLMGGDGIASDEFAAVGGPGVEGTLMTYGPDPRNRPEAKAAVEKFRAKNFEPESYTLYSYAAIEIVKQAAEAAKSLDPKKVAAQMKSGQKFKTVIGDLSFDKKGDVTRLDYVVYVWKKDASGKITYSETK